MAHGKWINRLLVALASAAAIAASAQSMMWKMLPGAATDIGVGADGTAWVIGTNVEIGGYGIFRWNGSNWDKVSGSAVRIAVDPQGKAWVVTNGHAIFHFDGQQFVVFPRRGQRHRCRRERRGVGHRQ